MFFGSLSNSKSKRSAHVLLGEGSGKNLEMFWLRKVNFIIIKEFKYGQTWKIWPSPLSLSLYSTFKPFSWVKYGQSIYRMLSQMTELVSLPCSYGRSIHYFSRQYDFLITSSRFYQDVHVNSLFPHLTRFWNSLPENVFLWQIYYLNSLNSRTDHLWALSNQLSCIIFFYLIFFLFLLAFKEMSPNFLKILISLKKLEQLLILFF